ncbi:MAG: isocitrate/isopropylmalate dehydrogenase family protein [Candidatus Bathyarchaeota archaeon]|nr:isocitrate/isopropylmalate dehydrogenase family protein [Candidatus Bathyarchaeota archaeon]UCD26958.1 MAG: isocitrate/isopropylmalate dehydrogenase family protein [Candidatus Bathyarchaeota archaeon]
MSRKYKIVVLRGDGVSQEVVPEAVKTLKAAQDAVAGLELDFVEFECGFEYYQKTGDPWPPQAYKACKEADAILYGAVGLPGVEGLEDIVYVHRMLRQNLDLYANVRPVKLRENVPCPLAEKKPGDIDFVVIRENTEGLYAPMRGVLTRAEVTEVALDIKIVTRKGARRIIEYAFELCRRRGRGAPLDGKLRVTCVDKSTVLKSCALFREVYNEVAEGYPDIEKDYALIDAWTQWALRRPEYYDVVVTTNLFGDIITDMSAPIQGGLGLAPSAEIGDEHGMFRPIHGSAPKYRGKYVTNPLATILSAKMLMDWLADKHSDRSTKEAAKRIEKAVDLTLKEGKVLPRDLGGSSKTNEVGDEIVRKISVP